MSAVVMTCMVTVYFTPQKSGVPKQSSQYSTVPAAKYALTEQDEEYGYNTTYAELHLLFLLMWFLNRESNSILGTNIWFT